MRQENIESPIQYPKLRCFENPYLKVRIDARDHENLKEYRLADWTRSVTCNTWNDAWNRKWVGLQSSNSNTSVDLTKTITLPTSGYYLLQLYARYAPSYNGTVNLKIDDVSVDGSRSLTSPDDHLSMIMYPPQKITSGSKTFKVTLGRQGFVYSLQVIPLTRYEGDNQSNTFTHTNRLDLSSIDFTQNSIGEMNPLSLKIPMHEEYWRKYTGYSPFVFDYVDSMTVWMGESMKNTVPLWGGYVSSIGLNQGEIEVRGVDRLFDLDREAIYKNFAIAGSSTENQGTKPFTFYPNVYEIARYLARNPHYPIKYYTVPYEYAFFNDFSNSSQYNSVSTTTWGKYWDQRMGVSKPCLKLYTGSSSGTATANLYSNNYNPYDAAEYNRLTFYYYYGGVGVSKPLGFNVVVSMYKTGQDYTDAVDYTINFTGPGGASNVLTGVNAVKNSKWNQFTVDLNALFDTKAASTNYYITNIKFGGVISAADAASKTKGAVWIDKLMAYKSISHAPKYASQDVKTYYEELKQLCERTNHAAYVSFGDSRDDDTLIIQPEKTTTCAGTIDEKDNLLDVDAYEYTPLDGEVVNLMHQSFNFDENNSGYVVKIDEDSMKHYGELGKHEFNSDVNNQSDAGIESQNYIDTHGWPTIAFGVKIRGSTQLLPLQYATCNLPSYRITGDQQIKSITHNWTVSDGYTTTVDFNQPGRKFRNLVFQLRNDLKNLGVRDSRTVYNTGGSRYIGLASSGAFNSVIY